MRFKSVICFAMVFAIATVFAACGKEPSSSLNKSDNHSSQNVSSNNSSEAENINNSSEAENSENSTQNVSDEQEITLVADFSCGSEIAEDLDLIRTELQTVEESTPEAMANALSEWSGLDFTLNSVTVDESYVIVDWAASSTLVAGLDDREQKEDFFFYDQESLRWFMMDSLYSTLIANLGELEIYYTMNGGEDLAFDQLEPVNMFPADIPYMGSPFYFAHADLEG